MNSEQDVKISRRGWIIAGAVLLHLMLMAGAFSLGIYLERYGLTDTGLSFQPGQAPGGPQNQQPQQPPPGQQAQPVPAGQQNQNLPPGLTEPPQLIGRVLHIDGGLELATGQGPRSITLSPQTRYRDTEGEELARRDIETQMVIAIYGQFRNAGQELVAEEIVVLPPLEDKP